MLETARFLLGHWFLDRMLLQNTNLLLHVGNENLGHLERESMTAENTLNDHFLEVGHERVGGDEPASDAKTIGEL